MRKYTYQLQAFGETLQWFTLGGCSDVPLQWAHGFMAARQEMNGPMLPLRILRSDGKIVAENAGRIEVSIGLVAGFPSPEQYERAAERALQTAAKIREHRRNQIRDARDLEERDE